MSSNNGESRESLDLLASAAEQSSPQSRIKRNTACVSCRDSKVRCNASAVHGQPCQRCAKLSLPCVVDKSHKRVSKRSRFEELVQEVQNIKQAVGPRGATTTTTTTTATTQGGQQQQMPLPSIPQTNHLLHPQQQQQQQQHSPPAPPATGTRLYPTVAFSPNATPMSSISSFSGPAPPRGGLGDASSVPSLTPGDQMTTPSTTTSTSRPAQPRALKSRVFAGQDIDVYFDKYFKDFHPYLPIVRMREPDAIYNAGPVLFWVIMVTACRRLPHDGGVFDFLIDSIKSEVWDAVSDPPMSLATINAMLILSAWPLPTIRFMKDPSPIYTSMLMNSCYLLGIQTGRGDIPTLLYPVYRLAVSNEEAVYTWLGYNIVSQRISTYSGTPSTGQFFNRTIESVLDRTSSFKIPTYFYVQLESAAFLNRLSRVMSATLEEERGVSHHIVDQLSDDFTKVQRLMSSVDISDVDHFTILSTLLEVQIYYFVPTPNFSLEIYRRNTLRCCTTAHLLVQLALKLQAEINFLSHAPHFVCRTLLTAGCVLISALVSPTLRDAVETYIRQLDGVTTPDMVVLDAVASIRHCSVQEADLPLRCSKMMESAWNVRNVLPATEISQLGDPQYSHRMGMGLPLDCIRRWKRQMEQIRPEKLTPQPPGAGGGADIAGAGGGVAAGSSAVVPDLTAMIDWDAFMKDFDWNFDPSLIETVVT